MLTNLYPVFLAMLHKTMTDEVKSVVTHHVWPFQWTIIHDIQDLLTKINSYGKLCCFMSVVHILLVVTHQSVNNLGSFCVLIHIVWGLLKWNPFVVLGQMKMSGPWQCSGSSSSPGCCLWRESIGWCENGIPASIPMGIIFHNFCSFTQNNPEGILFE